MTTYNFSKLIKKQIFTIQLRLNTPLHIGGSYDTETDTDLPVIRTKDGTPYIPGSSIKGVLRSASEKLYHLVDDQPVCFLEKEKSCTFKLKNDISHILEKFDEEEAYHRIYEKICPVCRTYGMGAIASKVFIPNVLLEKENTMVRDGIKIDRETNVVSDSAKFDYEYVEAGQIFTIRIEAENMTEENEKVLGIALLQLKKNYIRLGGLQSRGLGELEYLSGNVETIDFSAKNRQQALQILLGNNDNRNTISLEQYLHELFLGG